MDIIEFACVHCDQRFRVARRNCGRKLRCPACNTSIRVPPPEVAVVQLADRAAQRQQREWTEFHVDPDHPFEFEVDEADRARARCYRRWVGGSCLVVMLGLLAYQSGIRWGSRHGTPSPAAQRRNLQTLSGRVVGLDRASDEAHGAARDVLLVAIPSDRQLEQRIPAMVMLPDARDSKEYQHAVRSIQLIGGDVAVSDAKGQFVWSLATPDLYEIIAVSNAATVADVPRGDLAAVGHAFVPAYDLLAGRRYQIRHRVRLVAGDQLTIEFPDD